MLAEEGWRLLLAQVGSHAGQPARPVTEMDLPPRPLSGMTNFDPLRKPASFCVARFLFDHFVGACQQWRRHVKPHSLRGLLNFVGN
jgi:hypothetical protein